MPWAWSHAPACPQHHPADDEPVDVATAVVVHATSTRY